METIQTFTSELSILEISYLVASVLFILGLKKLSHPATARSGNLWAAAGMGAAILFTILFHQKDGQPIGNVIWIVVALAIGSFMGWYASIKVKMTAMPQMVSIFNGMGGACAALISMMEFPKMQDHLAQTGAAHMLGGEGIAILLGLMIGGVSFAGSMIAFGKLDGRIGDFKHPVLRFINLTFLVGLFVALVLILFMKPVEGNNGVYVALVTTANMGADQNVSAEKQQLSQNLFYRVSSQVTEVQRKKAEITDKRAKFY